MGAAWERVPENVKLGRICERASIRSIIRSARFFEDYTLRAAVISGTNQIERLNLKIDV